MTLKQMRAEVASRLAFQSSPEPQYKDYQWDGMIQCERETAYEAYQIDLRRHQWYAQLSPEQLTADLRSEIRNRYAAYGVLAWVAFAVFFSILR